MLPTWRRPLERNAPDWQAALLFGDWTTPLTQHEVADQVLHLFGFARADVAALLEHIAATFLGNDPHFSTLHRLREVLCFVKSTLRWKDGKRPPHRKYT